MSRRCKLTLLSFVIALAAAVPARAQVPTEADLVKLLGTKKQGWLPLPFKVLKAKMSVEDVAKAFPGAAQVSKFGFARFAAAGMPGVAEIEFYFAKDKATGQPAHLQSVRLSFDPKLTDLPGFWETLVKVCEAKFGKKAKPEQLAKKIITWVGPRFKTAQLTKFPARGGAVYQLNVAF